MWHKKQGKIQSESCVSGSNVRGFFGWRLWGSLPQQVVRHYVKLGLGLFYAVILYGSMAQPRPKAGSDLQPRLGRGSIHSESNSLSERSEETDLFLGSYRHLSFKRHHEFQSQVCMPYLHSSSCSHFSDGRANNFCRASRSVLAVVPVDHAPVLTTIPVNR